MENNWAVLSEYRYPVVRITKTTEQMAWYVKGAGRDRRVYRDKLVATMLSEDAAKQLSERMISAEAEMNRRIRAARAWFNNEQSRLAVAAREVF